MDKNIFKAVKKARCRAKIVVPPETFIAVITNGVHPSFVVTNGLPKGARHLYTVYDHDRERFELFFEHKSFRKHFEGEVIQQIYPSIRLK